MNFESIASKHPSEEEALEKLRDLLSKAKRKEEEFTLNRLCDLVAPNSREELAIILGEMARGGLIKLVVRVVSPSAQGGIGDFPTLDEVPDVVHDWRTDSEVQVSPENLRVIYKAA
jgi:hypothetical protein